MDAEQVGTVVEKSVAGLIKGFEPLAAQLKVPAEKLYWFSVKRSVAEAVSDSVIALSVLLISVAVIWYFRALSSDWPEGEDRTIARVAPVVFVALFGAPLFVVYLVSAIRLFIAPEWYAVKYLVETVVGGGSH